MAYKTINGVKIFESNVHAILNGTAKSIKGFRFTLVSRFRDRKN